MQKDRAGSSITVCVDTTQPAAVQRGSRLLIFDKLTSTSRKLMQLISLSSGEHECGH